MSIQKTVEILWKRNIYYFALASSAKKICCVKGKKEKRRKYEREREQGKTPKFFHHFTSHLKQIKLGYLLAWHDYKPLKKFNLLCSGIDFPYLLSYTTKDY